MVVQQQKNMRLHDFRLANQTLKQRTLSIVALMFVLHFAIGMGLWLLFIWCQTANVIRNSDSAQVWHNLAGWLPFYSRMWKSTSPLGCSLVALYLVPYRPKLSLGLLIGIAVFSIGFAWHDISTEQYDMATFGPPWGGHTNHYFNWWWCHRRPK